MTTETTEAEDNYAEAMAQALRQPDETTKVHDLKTVAPWFGMVFHGEKTAELRKHDRPFHQFDRIRLREYLPDQDHYTGSEVLAKITGIVTDADGPWLSEGHCMLSIKVLELKP